MQLKHNRSIFSSLTRHLQAHAHLATLHYLSTTQNNPPSLTSLAMSLKHFCRSVELNDSYLRGFYGLKLISSKLTRLLSESSSSTTSKRNLAQEDDDVSVPSISTLQKLEELATNKLAEIVRQYKSGNKAWQGFDEADVIAARELLDRDGQT